MAQQESFQDRLQNVLLRRFFVVSAFEIYGGVAGLYDLGPQAAALRNNMVDLWRRHFVIEEDMVEVQCTNLVPECVLQASGHVAKFADLMVKDMKNGECFRADKLIETFLEARLAADRDFDTLSRKDPMLARLSADEHLAIQRDLNAIDGAGVQETARIVAKYGIKSPSGNDLSEPFPFNLMFSTQIGPSQTNSSRAYLRPETAQGIFMNFKRALEYSRGLLPFAMAQVGTSFRNEISPRAGLLRVREFEAAEIEHFMRDGAGRCDKFARVAGLRAVLFTADEQLVGKPTGAEHAFGDAVRTGLIRHETLGYFMARTLQFLTALGLDPARLRFRQHLPKQLAHYARDCYDVECLVGAGWVEIVGIADRSAFDLECHSRASGVDLKAFVKYDEPRTVEYHEAKPVMGVIGREFKKDGARVKALLEALPSAGVEDLAAAFAAGQAYTLAGEFALRPEHVTLSKGSRVVHGEAVTPFVCEPSFGLGRILYCLLEHAFYVREQDDKRTVFRFSPAMASTKVAVLPLLGSDALSARSDELVHALRAAGISCKADASGVPIGRRYARMDEIGVCFDVTVDFGTLDDGSVTVRERDSMQQIRLPAGDVLRVVGLLCAGALAWGSAVDTYGLVASTAVEED